MLHNKELCDLYISPEIVKVVKYVSSIGKQQMHTKFSNGSLSEVSCLEDHRKQY
jgi:hypothetical protein